MRARSVLLWVLYQARGKSKKSINTHTNKVSELVAARKTKSEHVVSTRKAVKRENEPIAGEERKDMKVQESSVWETSTLSDINLLTLSWETTNV